MLNVVKCGLLTPQIVARGTSLTNLVQVGSSSISTVFCNIDPSEQKFCDFFGLPLVMR